MLEARGISFSYAADRAILDGVAFSVAPGERVWVRAPSGAGKTTLCRILAGYLAPDAGAVLVDGAPLPQRGPCPVQLIGQHPEHALDPRMRMRASLEEAGAPDPELCERLGIRSEWMARFPHELSGGELQRFCIARALMVQPPYLIADEISTMLDAVTQARIWRVLLEECEASGKGLVFTTHSPALGELIATRVFQLGAA